MNKGLSFGAGLGMGIGVMYLVDPDRGKRRRALLRDKCLSATRKTGEVTEVTARDFTNRAQGIAASIQSRFTSAETDDAVLVDRMRSKLGRIVSHPGAIEVASENGNVTLSGPILEAEVDSLLTCVKAVQRVNEVAKALADLPQVQVIMCDVTPRQLLGMTSNELPSGFQKKLQRYRYGPGAFKVDWALKGPVPWKAVECFQAATVHLGASFEEIFASESATWLGQHSERPFVIVCQPSLFDPSRAPQDQHTLWAYCHVPNGSTVDMTERIENQIERFALGFRDQILAKHVMCPATLEEHNANLIGGDINGGVQDLRQLFTRPTMRAYSTPLKCLYICSSSTPPGGGVHGMCGYHAARRALQKSF
jgi:hypothetical protein